MSQISQNLQNKAQNSSNSSPATSPTLAQTLTSNVSIATPSPTATRLTPKQQVRTVFEKSQTGQKAYSLPKQDSSFSEFMPPKDLLRKSSIELPEISELDLMRHFSYLAKRNIGIDTNFYPLGSCTMKYNPRVNEWAASLPKFTRTHPLAPVESVQGNLQITYELIQTLCQVCGMTAGSLAPCAGAQGEYVGVRMISAYHESRGESFRDEMIIPDNAHGTNPATAQMAGYKIVSVPTNNEGDIDIDQLKAVITERTAGLMLTNPNTLGLFSSKIIDITRLIHGAGGLLYYDGANLNAIMNIAAPGDMGFDVMHINLHKTFSTPHGGGGPGSGPVLCNDRLKPFLPIPQIISKGEGCYQFDVVGLNGKNSDTQMSTARMSIGRISSFYGNFAIYLRAYLYVKLHGLYGLRRISEQAVLNANYLKVKLSGLFTVPFKQYCMHEFVVQADNYLEQGVTARDIAKRMIDYGVHAPTIYFPLIIKECMLIEPTETESKATLDRFLEIMAMIVEEIKVDPEIVKKAPHCLPVGRLDETRAAKTPILRGF